MAKGPKTHPLSLAKKKYSRHKAQSKFRKIDFNFTFDEWYNWWLKHGVDKNSIVFERPERVSFFISTNTH